MDAGMIMMVLEEEGIEVVIVSVFELLANISDVVIFACGGIIVVSNERGVVMMVSCRQVEPLKWNVTSARCAQVESVGGLNSRPITGCVMFCDMHILTRESQEVMVGTVNILTTDLATDIDVASMKLIVWTDIPHSGQLNITSSTPSTPI